MKKKLSSMLFLLLMTAWTQMFASGGSEPPFNQDQALKPAEIVEGKEIALWVVNNANNWYTGIKGSRSANLTDAVTFIVENAGNGNIYLKRKSDGMYMKYTAYQTSASWVETSGEATAFTARKPGTGDGEDGVIFNYNYTTDANLSDPPSWDPNYEYLVRFAVASTADDTNPMFFNGNTAFDTGTGNWSAFLVMDVNSNIVVPFVTTTIEDDQFKNATWYRISIHATESKRHYWKYDVENSSVGLTNTTDEDNFNVFSDDQLFCFVYTNNKDIKIFNKAAGPSKWVTYDESKVSVGTGDAETGTWTLTSSSVDATDFCFKTNKSGVTNCYINNHEGTQLAYWHSNDAGSTCYFTVFDVQEALANLTTTLEDKLNSAQSAIGFVGAPVSVETVQASVNEFKQNQTQENYNKVLAAFEDAIQIESGKYYRVINADYATRDVPQYVSFAPNQNGKIEAVNVSQMDDLSVMPQTLIRFDEVEETDGIMIYNLNIQGENIGHTWTENKDIYLSNRTGAGHSYITGNYELINKNVARYVLYCKNPENTGTGGNKVCITVLNNGTTISTWGDGVLYSQWFIQPVEDIGVVIPEVGYATVNYPFAVKLPSNLKAYTGEAINSTTFALTEVPEGKVPANTPVVLNGTQETYHLTIDTENVNDPIASDLSGTLLPETIEPTITVYGLANGNYGIGFYKLSDAEDVNRTIGANKAYLKAEELPAGGQNVRGLIFSFNENTTTGIEDKASEVVNDEYYDLQGCRVMNPSRGIYITKSGKKILFTK